MSAIAHLHHLHSAAPDAVLLADRQGRITAVNEETETLFGWPERELIGEPIGSLLPARFRWLLTAELGSHVTSPLAASRRGAVRCAAVRRDGTEFPVELMRRSVGTSGRTQSMVMLRDLTRWSAAQDDHARHDARARNTLESIGDAVIVTDVSGGITYLNPVAERLTGWTARDAQGERLETVLSLIAEATRLPVDNTAARCVEEGRAIDLEDGVLLVRRDGTEVPIGDSAAPIWDPAGELLGVVLVIQDESEKRRVGHRLSFEATHDELTGLVNRREFERRLTRMVNEGSAAGCEHVLLWIDLDHFKVVNDRCGHDAGDALLRGLGAVLSGHLRKRDTLARIGGDEFGVLLQGCPLDEAERIAEKIRHGVAAHPFEWAGSAFPIAASVGVVPISADSGEMVAALRSGDAACYAAKEHGGNRVHVERPGPDATEMAQARSQRVTRLARAVDEAQFRLYAQPIVVLRPELPSRARFEVLVRLPDGKGGVETAADFLPQAERYNLMPAIDRWVLRETIALLGQWHRDHPDSELPVCSVNVSAASLADDTLVSLLEHQLALHDVPSDAICLEVAEAAALANIGRTVRFLSGVREAGCSMALEDLGGGVTSLTYLKQLPVDFLKIGGHFVRGVVEEPIYGSIVRAVDRIGRSMGMSTVAKQVGSAQALHKLRSLGIGFAQGRAVGPPTPLTDDEGAIRLPGLQLLA